MTAEDKSHVVRQLEEILAPLDRHERRRSNGCLVVFLCMPVLVVVATQIFGLPLWQALLAAPAGWFVLAVLWFAATTPALEASAQSSLQEFNRQFAAGSAERRVAREILDRMSVPKSPGHKESAKTLVAKLPPAEEPGQREAAAQEPKARPASGPAARPEAPRYIPLDPESSTNDQD